jgi:hypothetical protein
MPFESLRRKSIVPVILRPAGEAGKEIVVATAIEDFVRFRPMDMPDFDDEAS